MSNGLSLKKHELEYLSALKKVILSKEEFHIWSCRELILEINEILHSSKILRKKLAVGNSNEMGRILSLCRDFYKFKSHHNRTRYIFIRKKKLEINKIEFVSESSLIGT